MPDLLIIISILTLFSHMQETEDEGLRSPHGEAIKLEKLAQGDNRAKVAIPYNNHLIGDPETGVVHGGVITTLLDTACGMSVRSDMEPGGGTAIATLDLRVDYMRPATPGEKIYAEAECCRRTRNIAFVRGTAYHQDVSKPIAICTATFMLGTPNTRRL